MGKAGSIGKTGRVNIQIADYLPAGMQPELPFKIVAMGDYTLRPEDTEVGERKRVMVNKDDFSNVMKNFHLSLDLTVKNRMVKGDEQLPVQLKFESLKDFRPEAIAKQVPQLQKLLALRNAVKALRNPMSGKKEFVKQLNAILKDEDQVQKIVAMLAPKEGGDKPAQA